MGRVIAVANQKGGVGKTTTSINLACSMSSSGHRTLLIDCDPQANSTASLGFHRDPTRRSIYHALTVGDEISSITLPSGIAGLDLVPSEKNLVGATIELVTAEKREYRLRKALEPVRTNYDYIVLDCPPALDILTLNALVAADSVLVPIQCEYLALEGVTELIDTLMRIRKTLNPQLRIEGILPTMYDERTTLSRQVVADLRDFFGSRVFTTVIPRNVRLAEAPSHGKPISIYDPASRGARSYAELAKEVITNGTPSPGKGSQRATA